MNKSNFTRYFSSVNAYLLCYFDRLTISTRLVCMSHAFTVRNFMGALLCLILVGEVGAFNGNGLFTPAGFIILSTLYFTYFLLLDGLIARHHLSAFGVVLVNFALYSILITGFFHGEIMDYVRRPDEHVITTLIRVQSSLFPLFVYPLLNKFFPKRTPTIHYILPFAIFIGLMSLSQSFGLQQLAQTFRTVPRLSIACTTIALFSLYIGLQRRGTHSSKTNTFTVWCWVLLVLGLIPHLAGFLVLLLISLLVGGYFLLTRDFRSQRMTIN